MVYYLVLFWFYTTYTFASSEHVLIVHTVHGNKCISKIHLWSLIIRFVGCGWEISGINYNKNLFYII